LTGELWNCTDIMPRVFRETLAGDEGRRFGRTARRLGQFVDIWPSPRPELGRYDVCDDYSGPRPDDQQLI